MLRALIWDVDGTLAETERDGHRIAFNQAFEALGLPWRWDEARYGELLHVTGGYERLLRDMQDRDDAPPEGAQREQLARELHGLKNRRYGELVSAGGIPLRPGVRELFDDAQAAGMPMVIATTTSRVNVDTLLGAQIGADWLQRFAGVFTAEDAPRKKPDPQVYQLALRHLGLPARQTLALEDSTPGVRAARAAGIPVVVTRSVYFAQAPAEGALAVGPGLDQAAGWLPPARHETASRIDLDQLTHWHAQATA